jgi:hypothetical protein
VDADVVAFMDELRQSKPFFSDEGPQNVLRWQHSLDSVEALLRRLYAHREDDPKTIERLDQVREAIKPGSGTLQERYVKFCQLTIDWEL